MCTTIGLYLFQYGFHIEVYCIYLTNITFTYGCVRDTKSLSGMHYSVQQNYWIDVPYCSLNTHNVKLYKLNFNRFYIRLVFCKRKYLTFTVILSVFFTLQNIFIYEQRSDTTHAILLFLGAVCVSTLVLSYKIITYKITVDVMTYRCCVIYVFIIITKSLSQSCGVICTNLFTICNGC